MKVIVIGDQGMLGQDLVPRLKGTGFQVKGLDIEQLDITQYDLIMPILKPFNPNIIINCAAYTAVDKAESEPDLAFAVNRDGVANLARFCDTLDIPLIHISTDYVFDGQAEKPYREDNPAHPIGVYGKSKWEGEEAIRSRLKKHLIVRTAWLYGIHGKNFMDTILRLSCEKDELTIVSDQIGCPTWSGDLADALVRLVQYIEKEQDNVAWGTYHFCGQGKTSWYDFACAIIEEANKRETIKRSRILPIPTCDYPTPAKRPFWSVMDCSKIQNQFDIQPLHWKEGLMKMLAELYSDDPE